MNMPVASPFAGPASAAGISVVICTHNGATRLPAALRALARCRTDVPAELVVVDNASSDATAETARRCWDGLPDAPFPLRVVEEPKAGLSFARRAGVEAASHEIIVFCDDDNLLAPDYLSVALEVMRDPSVGAAGGCCTPVSDQELPPFFYKFAEWYAVGALALRPGELSAPWACLRGAGLVVRRRDLIFLYRIPGFPILSGRSGGSMDAGEDFEIAHCVALMGLRLIYDERLYFQHYIPSSRLHADYCEALMTGGQRGAYVVQLYAQVRGLTARQDPRSVAMRAYRLLGALAGTRTGKLEWFALLYTLQAPYLMGAVEREVYAIARKVRARMNATEESSEAAADALHTAQAG